MEAHVLTEIPTNANHSTGLESKTRGIEGVSIRIGIGVLQAWSIHLNYTKIRVLVRQKKNRDIVEDKKEDTCDSTTKKNRDIVEDKRFKLENTCDSTTKRKRVIFWVKFGENRES